MDGGWVFYKEALGLYVSGGIRQVDGSGEEEADNGGNGMIVNKTQSRRWRSGLTYKPIDGSNAIVEQRWGNWLGFEISGWRERSGCECTMVSPKAKMGIGVGDLRSPVIHEFNTRLPWRMNLIHVFTCENYLCYWLNLFWYFICSYFWVALRYGLFIANWMRKTVYYQKVTAKDIVL